MNSELYRTRQLFGFPSNHLSMSEPYFFFLSKKFRHTNWGISKWRLFWMKWKIELRPTTMKCKSTEYVGINHFVWWTDWRLRWKFQYHYCIHTLYGIQLRGSSFESNSEKTWFHYFWTTYLFTFYKKNSLKFAKKSKLSEKNMPFSESYF